MKIMSSTILLLAFAVNAYADKIEEAKDLGSSILAALEKKSEAEFTKQWASMSRMKDHFKSYPNEMQKGLIPSYQEILDQRKFFFEAISKSLEKQKIQISDCKFDFVDAELTVSDNITGEKTLSKIKIVFIYKEKKYQIFVDAAVKTKGEWQFSGAVNDEVQEYQEPEEKP